MTRVLAPALIALPLASMMGLALSAADARFAADDLRDAERIAQIGRER